MLFVVPMLVLVSCLLSFSGMNVLLKPVPIGTSHFPCCGVAVQLAVMPELPKKAAHPFLML